MYQERVASLIVLFLLIGFAIQYWIYSRSEIWLDPKRQLGDILLTAVAIGAILFILMLARWRSLRRDYAQRLKIDRQLHLLKEAVETMEIGITISDPEGRLLFANRAVADLFGLTDDQILSWRDDKGSRPEAARLLDPATVIAQGPSRTEAVLQRKNDNEIQVQLMASPVCDESGNLVGIVTGCEDITERKRAENELEEHRRQLRGLARHIENLRDDERARIAHEIHNDLGGALTVLKINLTMIEADLARSGSGQLDRAHRMSEDIDAMIDLVRSMSRQLRPFLLDDVGLLAAVEGLRDDLQRKTNLQFDTDLPEAEPDLGAEEKETLFRAFQEGTTNSLRHASATHIKTVIRTLPDEVTVEVTDNGIGVKTNPFNERSAFGLVGLRERVLGLGGTIYVGPSIDDNGTTLRVSIPFDREEAR